jgi:integrase
MSENNSPHQLEIRDPFAAAVAQLPPLPRTVVYEDDYDEKTRSIVTETAIELAWLFISGKRQSLNFSAFGPRIRELIRVFLLSSLVEYAPHSIAYYYKNLRSVQASTIEEIAMSSPRELQRSWPQLSNGLATETLSTLKRLIAYLCQCNFGNWRPHFQDMVSSLPVPRRDLYSTIRSGDCFIGIEEEVNIVRWLDNAASVSATLKRSAIETACLLVCSYQFGMRPKQLGVLRKRDCSVRWSGEDGSAIVHLSFRTLKQRDPLASRLPLLRRVKREWASLLVVLIAMLKDEPSDTFLFGFESRAQLSSALTAKLGEIIPGQNRVAYDLRHSMAQRMVDAGASQEELASALGHTHLKTGLVYFRASANQAELVNKALGLSETYQTVAKIAADKFISTNELAKLKGEQQVAGVPHGLPIAGIGGCSTGQPSCPYNPVTACYGCPKFMPVRDVALHQQVLKDFRSVVNLYKDSGAGEQESPAYLQLRRTINDVQGIINQLEGGHVP